MVEEPSHVKQLSLNRVCKIGLKCRFLQNDECQSLGSVVKEENMSFAVVYEMADMENSARVFPCNRWGRKKTFLKVVFSSRVERRAHPLPI